MMDYHSNIIDYLIDFLFCFSSYMRIFQSKMFRMKPDRGIYIGFLRSREKSIFSQKKAWKERIYHEMNNFFGGRKNNEISQVRMLHNVTATNIEFFFGKLSNFLSNFSTFF